MPKSRLILSLILALVMLGLVSGCGEDKQAADQPPTTQARAQSVKPASKPEPKPEADRPPAPKAEASRPESDRPKPDFTLTALDGSEIRLAKFRGQVVLVNFWAAWCPPCRKEVPELAKLHRQWEAKGVHVIGLALEPPNRKAEVEAFVKKHNLPYPVALASQDIPALFGGVSGIPTTIVLKRNGEIAEKFVGYASPETIEYVIKKYL